jgi:hypothetical protein
MEDWEIRQWMDETRGMLRRIANVLDPPRNRVLPDKPLGEDALTRSTPELRARLEAEDAGRRAGE